jgi:hypothetical protein
MFFSGGMGLRTFCPQKRLFTDFLSRMKMVSRSNAMEGTYCRSISRDIPPMVRRGIVERIPSAERAMAINHAHLAKRQRPYAIIKLMSIRMMYAIHDKSSADAETVIKAIAYKRYRTATNASRKTTTFNSKGLSTRVVFEVVVSPNTNHSQVIRIGSRSLRLLL